VTHIWITLEIKSRVEKRVRIVLVEGSQTQEMHQWILAVFRISQVQSLIVIYLEQRMRISILSISTSHKVLQGVDPQGGHIPVFTKVIRGVKDTALLD
jgi:hypothetical protein